MTNRVGYLTIFSSDKSEIYGGFCDADWAVEESDSGSNHVFTGIASEGALDTFRRINYEGISHVAYIFEALGYRYEGAAQLLAPESGPHPGTSIIRIESIDRPSRV
jgi:hypothetical protein